MTATQHTQDPATLLPPPPPVRPVDSARLAKPAQITAVQVIFAVLGVIQLGAGVLVLATPASESGVNPALGLVFVVEAVIRFGLVLGLQRPRPRAARIVSLVLAGIGMAGLVVGGPAVVGALVSVGVAVLLNRPEVKAYVA